MLFIPLVGGHYTGFIYVTGKNNSLLHEVYDKESARQSLSKEAHNNTSKSEKYHFASEHSEDKLQSSQKSKFKEKLRKYTYWFVPSNILGAHSGQDRVRKRQTM